MIKLLKAMGLINMNSKDFKLITGLLILAFIMIILIYIFKDNGAKAANVYYKNQLVLTIDMTLKTTKEYTVSGTNGDVVILYDNGKIKVEEENSPRHLCSKQGWISQSYESIICLPNNIVINITGIYAIDTIVK